MVWPTTLDVITDFGLLTNNFETTLSGNIDAVVTTIPLTSTTGIVAPGGFFLTINSEIIFCSGVSGLNAIVTTRGAQGTSAAAHSNTDPVYMYVVRENVNQFASRMIALQEEIGITTSPAVGSVRRRLEDIEGGYRTWSIIGGISGVGANSTKVASYGHTAAIGSIPMVRSGNIVALSCGMSVVGTAGSCTTEIVKNGVAQTGVNQRIILDGLGGPGEIDSRLRGALVLGTPVSYAVGDHFLLQTVTSGWSPTGSDATLVAFMEDASS